MVVILPADSPFGQSIVIPSITFIAIKFICILQSHSLFVSVVSIILYLLVIRSDWGGQ